MLYAQTTHTHKQIHTHTHTHTHTYIYLYLFKYVCRGVNKQFVFVFNESNSTQLRIKFVIYSQIFF